MALRIKPVKIIYFGNCFFYLRKKNAFDTSKIHMMERKDLEAAVDDVDKRIDACVKAYTFQKLSASDYFAQMGGIEHVDITHPSLPTGMVDMAEFREIMTTSTPELTEQRLQLAAIEAELKVYAGADKTAQAAQQCLRVDRERLKGRIQDGEIFEKHHRWRYLMQNGGDGVMVMDGKGFKAKLSTLLQEKMDLMIMLTTMKIAEQVPQMLDEGMVAESQDSSSTSMCDLESESQAS